MSFAYLPFYTGDYFRDTRGLSMAGHGCYLLLLTYCWDSKGPLPLDEERIAGICEARNQEERTTLSRILTTYFVRMEDGWYNARMQREIERCNSISAVRTEAGRRGANERMRKSRKGKVASARQEPSNSLASAKQVTLTSSPSPSPSPTPTPGVIQNRVTGFSKSNDIARDDSTPDPKPEPPVELAQRLAETLTRPAPRQGPKSIAEKEAEKARVAAYVAAKGSA